MKKNFGDFIFPFPTLLLFLSTENMVCQHFLVQGRLWSKATTFGLKNGSLGLTLCTGIVQRTKSETYSLGKMTAMACCNYIPWRTGSERNSL